MNPAKVMLVALCCATSPAFADCSTYPYRDGAIPEMTSAGLRIIATGSASVNFDDASSVRDARIESEMVAKAAIAKYMEETIKSDAAIKRSVEDSLTMQGNDKAVTRQETTKRLISLRSSSAGLLRGVVTLGECYTPGRELRVTVGIKPETLAGASNLSGAIRNSGSTGTSEIRRGPNGSSQGGMNRVPGYSDTDRLNRF